MKHLKKIVLTANLLFVLLAGFALGLFSTQFLHNAIADNAPDNYIYACVKTSNGTMHIVTSTSCGSGETSLVWNKKDVPGMGSLVNDLRGAKFKWTDLSYRNLHGQDLTNAVFSSSGFNTFYHIDLSNTNLTNAGLNGNFGGANLSNANLTNTDLGGDFGEGTNFTNDDFRPAASFGRGFSNTNLTNTNFSGLNLNFSVQSANLTDANMSSTSATTTIAFSSANLTRTNFTTASLPGSQFDSTTVDHTNFTGATLTSTNFSSATLTNTNFTNADLTSANFSGATFTSVIWSNTTCPDGTNSNSNGNTCNGHL